MSNVNKIETKLDYAITSAAIILLLLVSKNVFPVYVYTFIAIIISLYFFPIRYLLYLYKKYIQKKVTLIFTGLLFTILLVLSILDLYLPKNIFVKYTISAVGVLNLIFMLYYYVRFNKFLLLNFLFVFIATFANSLLIQQPH